MTMDARTNILHRLPTRRLPDGDIEILWPMSWQHIAGCTRWCRPKKNVERRNI